MKTILMIAALVLASAGARAEETPEQAEKRQVAENRVCEVFHRQLRVAKSLKAQREVEALSGVRDMKAMRDLAARFNAGMDDLFAAMKDMDKAGGTVGARSMHQDCSDVTAAEEKVFDDEFKRYLDAKDIKVKGVNK